MKRIGLIIVVLFSLFVFTGCSNKKTAIAPNDFLNKAGSYVSLNNYSTAYGIANVAYQTNNEEYKVLYLQAKNISDIKGMYIDEAKNVYANAGIVDQSASEGTNAVDNKYTKKTSAGKNWASVEITTDVKYYYLEYIDDTLLYLEGNIDKKDLLIQVRDAIGY